MRVKNKKLQWFVLNWDFNSNKLYYMNIFDNSFKEDLYKFYRSKKLKSLQDLKDFIERYCRWRFWARREYEILVGDLSSKDEDFVKVDVYQQVEKNLDRITEYVNNYLQIGL